MRKIIRTISTNYNRLHLSSSKRLQRSKRIKKLLKMKINSETHLTETKMIKNKKRK